MVPHYLGALHSVPVSARDFLLNSCHVISSLYTSNPYLDNDHISFLYLIYLANISK